MAKYCRYCGKKLRNDAVKCPKCGHYLAENHLGEEEPGQGETEHNETGDRGKEKASMVIFGLIMLIIGIAIGTGVYMIMNGIGPFAGNGRETVEETQEDSQEDTIEESSESDEIESSNTTESISTQKKTPAEKAANTPTPTPTPTVAPPSVLTPTSTPIPTPTTDPKLSYVTGIVDPSTNKDIYIPGATESSYLWPDADKKYYSDSDLDGLSQGQVRYLINEIYAREGYTFNNSLWASYFAQKSWYSATVANADFAASPQAYLNEYEYANINLITNYQTKHGYQDYS